MTMTKDMTSTPPSAASASATGLVLVVMGVSGSGKSTIAEKIAARLGWPMIEGDDLHPPANIAKMQQHQPLNDADRQPWLAAIGRQVDRWRVQGSPGIITCSALKRRYRDGLVADGALGPRPQLCFVYLKGSRELIHARLAQRAGHFMPIDLLDSQFADLEEPGPDEPAITVDIGAAPEAIAASIIAKLHLMPQPALLTASSLQSRSGAPSGKSGR